MTDFAGNTDSQSAKIEEPKGQFGTLGGALKELVVWDLIKKDPPDFIQYIKSHSAYGGWGSSLIFGLLEGNFKNSAAFAEIRKITA